MGEPRAFPDVRLRNQRLNTREVTAMATTLLGIGVSRGIAVGRARILQRGQLEVLEYALPDHLVEEEVVRFENALTAARRQLLAVRDRIPADTPDEIAAFIDTHLLMLEDATLASAPVEIIRRRRCNAEWAVKTQQDALEKVFDAMDDEYLKTRRDDVAHVAGRILRILQEEPDRPQPQPESDAEPRIVLAADLSPSDLLLLHQQQVAAVVTERGGPLSHTAILARNLGIPAVMGVRHAYQYVREDEMVVVDGERGTLLAGLDATALAFYRGEQRARKRARAALRRLKDQPAVTRDGVEITLRVNVDLPRELPAVRRVGASGVGLFRTEFLYMNRRTVPAEEEQFRIYRTVVKRLRGLPLTLRTIDLGVDKEVTMLSATASPLGLRAVRYCLKEVDLFRIQLRAALRASAYGPIRLLIPMLTHVGEAVQVRRLLGECMAELEAQGHGYDRRIEVGGMIEVPAAALCAEGLAEHLDFFSIGTNDLIQYTLAADRSDETVNHLYDPLNPAVLKLVRMVLEAGRGQNRPVALCGEMAGDPMFTRLLLGMGLTEFSMPPGVLLEIKEIVTMSDTRALKRHAGHLLRQRRSQAILEGLEKLNRA